MRGELPLGFVLALFDDPADLGVDQLDLSFRRLKLDGRSPKRPRQLLGNGCQGVVGSDSCIIQRPAGIHHVLHDAIVTGPAALGAEDRSEPVIPSYDDAP